MNKRDSFIQFFFWLIITILLIPTSAYPHTIPDPTNEREYFFRENKGQWEDHILFRADFGTNILFIEKTGFTWLQQHPDDLAERASCKFDPKCSFWEYPVRHFAFQMKFMGGNANPLHFGHNASREYFNYFRGNDPNKWASEVREYQKVVLENIYNGIDYHIYVKDGLLKYDLIVHPGADPSVIQMEYHGLLEIEEVYENLKLITGIHDIFEQQPYSFQTKGKEEVYVPSRFELHDSIVSFDFPSGYDQELPLIIDPVLVFSTYSGSFSDNWGTTATPGLNGEMFAAGTVFAPGYPTTTGAFQASFSALSTLNLVHVDMGITKFSQDGSARIFSTYIGGSRSEVPVSLIVNSRGELVVLGISTSNNYPVTADAYQGFYRGGRPLPRGNTNEISINGSDIVVTVLNTTGTNVIGSTYVSGSENDGINAIDFELARNYGDQFRGEVIVDINDNIFVASTSTSNDFPTTSNSFQTQPMGGLLNGVVFSLNRTCSTLRFSTYLGGSNNDAAYSLKLDQSGNIIVGGGTRSNDFPTTNNALNPNYQGGVTDGFITKLANNGSQLLASTFYGTNQFDQIYFVEVDFLDNIYAFGQTRGALAPTEGTFFTQGGSQFVVGLSNNLNNLQFQSVFGSGRNGIDISPTAFMVDFCRRIYLSGWGGIVNRGFVPGSSTIGLPTTFDAIQNTTDGNDFYFMVLDTDASDLLFGSFYGGVAFTNPISGNIVGAEHVDGGTSRFSREGTIYQAVCAGCGGASTFPTTPGVVSPSNLSSNCNMAALKFDFDLIETTISYDTIEICSGNNIALVSDVNDPGAIYQWSSGQNSRSITVSEDGTYMVTAVLSDPCTYIQNSFTVINSLPTYSFQDTAVCDQSSVNIVLDSRAENIIWDTGETSQSVIISVEGTYTVEYSIGGCDFIDIGNVTFPISPEVRLTGDSLACEGDEVSLSVIETKGIAIEEYTWSTGENGNTITVTESGTYSVVGLSEEGCDDRSEISVFFIPQIPPLPEFLDTLICADGSLVVDLSIYVEFADLNWSDGSTSAFRIFENSGQYPFVIENICERLEGEVVLDKSPFDFGELPMYFPNAFSPNQDGVNDIFKPEFPADLEILSYKLQVFDRWGNKVFESENTDFGWDGVFDGQSMDPAVFAWIAEIEFFVCEEPQKKLLEGDITILK